MAEEKGQKRSFDINAVLDDSLQFETWDSDLEQNSPSPNKRPRLSDNEEHPFLPDSLQTLQNCHSHSQRREDSSETENYRENGKHENATETSENKVNDNTNNKRNHKERLNCDDESSTGTFIVSEDEHAELAEREESLTRAVTLEHGDDESNVEQQKTLSPACTGAQWRGTSIEADAGFVLSIVPQADLTSVMECLAHHRDNPDRLNIVVAEVLDRAPHPVIDLSADDQDLTARTTNTHGDERTGTNPTSGDQRGDCNQTQQKENTVHNSGDRLSTSESISHNSKSVNITASEEKQGAEVVEPGSSRGDDNRQQGNNEDNAHSIYSDVKHVIEKVKSINPQVKLNATEVYLLLIQHADTAGRRNIAIDALLQKYGGESSGTQKQDSTSGDDIFNQAVKLNSEFPHINPSEIYELLEREEGRANLLQVVREKLRAQDTSSGAEVIDVSAKPQLPKDDSISNDPLVRNDPVFRDMRIISRMFPEKDQNELYALVEAHYYKPDRVQVVIEELLQQERNSQDLSQSLPHALPDHTEAEAPVTAATPSTPVDPEEYLLHAEVDHLRDIFPDCDPNYIFERLEAHKATADRIKVIAAEMFERKDYPRLKDMQEKRTKAARKKHLQRMQFTLEEFLAKFPEAGTTFRSTDKEMKDSYRNHVDSQLKHDFPDFHKTYLTKVVQKHNHHLLPIMRELETTRAEILAHGGRSKKLRDVPKDEPLSYPEEPDEYFFYELWFTMNEEKVNDFFKEKEVLRQARVEEAKAQNQLYECHCCFEDECLFEDMRSCADGHLFCKHCIARSVEAAFGEGKTRFPCLTGTCEHQIPLSVLKELLPSSMFSKVLRKLQEEEVRQAGITDLVECPFCSFATIMSDATDRVFRCLNPECLRDSCRLCREPNHVPLRCEEVEKQKETDMRTFIEKRVTEAMLRKCHRCNKCFVKDVGCNKMTCICGATSCYVCREPDIDYAHFTGSNCTEGNVDVLHRQEMEKAEREAREEYLHLHPEAAGIELKFDPANLIPAEGDHHLNGGDSDDEDSHDDLSRSDSDNDSPMLDEDQSFDSSLDSDSDEEEKFGVFFG